MAASSAACYFKVKTILNKTETSTIQAINLNQSLSEFASAYLADKDVHIERAAGDDADTDLNTPFWVLKDFGCQTVTLWLRERQDAAKQIDENNNHIDGFNALMQASRQYDFYPKLRTQHNEKDRLFNDVVKLLQRNKLGFTSQQATTTGQHVAKTITDVMWYLDPFLDRMSTRSVTIPDFLKHLTGYRQLKKQNKKIPQLKAIELKDNLELLGELLMMPWMMNTKMSLLKLAIEALHTQIEKYHKFLTGMKTRTETNQQKEIPVRGFNDNWSLLNINPNPVLKSEYSAISQALSAVNDYEIIDLINFEPPNSDERRKWLAKLEVTCPVTLYTYRYGNYLGNVNAIWKVPVDPLARKASETSRVVNVLRDSVMTFATRRMRKDFIERYSRCLKIQPGILRNIHQFLTEFETSPNDQKEAELDDRLARFLLEGQDTEMLFDLRKNNGRPCDKKYDAFWECLNKILDETSAVHERRHTNTQYMPFAMSIEDLRNQVLERLPEGTPAPSISWIRLNFTPRNPYNKSASHYTGKFNVKFAVQQRLLRVQHEDSGFGRHQFQLLKSFVVQHRDYCDLQSLDDKAIIPVGEPGHSVSTGVRSHHGGLVANNNKIVALDHDFHVAGIVPSVCFKVEIPDSDHGSFYKGKVHVTVKDKVFEPSSPLRHSTETVKIIRALYSDDGVNAEKPILCRYTDGGPDHRTTYQSVQLCCLLEFIALDLDMIVSVRTAPSQSYHNPAERVMSTLNLALQNVSMEREKMSPAFEMQAKSLKSLKGIRTAASRNKHLKTAYVDSMEVPSAIIKQRFSKLKWTGHQINVHDAATADELSDLGDLLKLIDPDLDINNQKTWKSKTLQTFMEQHSRKRHYMFQLKKCTSNGCGYCVLNPPRLPEHIFNSLHFVPDPVEKNGEYQSFGEVYGTETDDTDRPGAKAQEPASLRDKSFKNLLVATKVRSFALCRECGKRRVVYSAKKLSLDEERSVMRVQEELVYMCGNPLFHAGIYYNTIIVKEGINCNSMMEAAYYAVKRHTEARLEIKMSGFLLGSTSFMFYNCAQFKKCGDCAATSDVQCRWNKDLTCHSEDTGLIISKDQCPQLENNKIFIPSGQETTISLKGRNLPVTAGFVYKCLVDTMCVDATLSGGNVNCSIKLQKNANKTVKQISVKYRPPLSPDVDCSDMISIDDIHENSVIVYNCNELAKGDCSICCALNKTNYKCSWDTNSCVYSNSTSLCINNANCPPPNITKLEPVDGPTHGGTILTLTGKHFGHWNDDTLLMLHKSEPVKIGDQNCKTSADLQDFDIKMPDEDFTEAYPSRIVCTVPTTIIEGDHKQNVTLQIDSKTSNQVAFVYKTPEVKEIIPLKGPESGKTLITILGRNLGIGNQRVNIKFNDNVKCTDVKPVFLYGENYNITCLTGKKESSGNKQTVIMNMDVMGRPYKFEDHFEYAPDPIVNGIEPMKGTLSGGTWLTVKGENLDNAGAITISSNEYKSMKVVCTRNSSEEAKCPVPETTDILRKNIMESINRSRRKRSTDGVQDCVEIPLSLYLDGVTHTFKISYCRDPELEKFNDGVLLYQSDDKYIKIKGEYLTLVATDQDFKVTIGLDECKIIELKPTEITCNPPEETQDNPVVNVTVGNIHVTLGRLQYPRNFELIAIIAGAAGGVLLLIVIGVCVGFGCFKHKVGKQAKKYENDLKNMEMEIIDVARQEFLDMHTTMSSVNRNLVEQGFPYHNYQQYSCNVMFAVDYLWTEPVMTDDERLRANKGMEALESLIYNKFFLVSVIGSLEKQRKFFIREKSNLAGNLCAVLMGRMDYLNEILCMLMKNLVHDSSGKKAHQKALFRRCESITEKLLSNWMSLCLYPHFKSHSGSPLYLLYVALQKTIEAGPIDAVTGDTKYTLSEEKLLKKFSCSMSEESLKFESKALTLNLVVNGGEEIFKCKVLDCDTISQVKSKCLNQIYVNFPASQLDVDPDELILEWHEGFGGSLRLQDHDNTSSKEGSWVRLNTLAHYSMKDESNLALVDPHSAETLQEEDYVNLTQVDMDVGGCNGSMDSTDALTSECEETQDELQYWHLVKKEEESLQKEKTAFAELYLNRLFTTKLSLKDYIKTMFDIVLDKEHCPPPTKFLLDFLDELGEQFKVDNDTIHGWKSHSYAIRVWAALMKMPSLLFDVQIPPYMDDNLNVISQVFIDSFSLSSQKFTKDSPSQKLIFHNEMIDCRERALEFYKNVKVDTQDHEELRQYLLEVNKLQQQTSFSKTSALYRFYKQIKPYLMDIVEDLATGKETKDLQLDKKLERVMQIMEEEEEEME